MEGSVGVCVHAGGVEDGAHQSMCSAVSGGDGGGRPTHRSSDAVAVQWLIQCMG